MKLSITSFAWEPNEDKNIADLLKELDIKSIDTTPQRITNNINNTNDPKVDEFLEFWNENNIYITALQSLLYKQPDLQLFNTKEARKKTLEYLKNTIDFAAGIGIDKLVFGSYQNRKLFNTDKTVALDIATDFFSNIGEHAAKNHIKFCIEPISGHYGCEFLTTTKDTVDFLKKINSQGLGLLLDIGAMTLNNEDYIKTLEYSFDYIEHIHISEPDLKPIGTLDTDHKLIADTLIRLGYNKYLTIEIFKTETNNIEVIKQSLEYVIKTYF